jgi:hypothetical protein
MSRARWRHDLSHSRSWSVKLSIYLATKTNFEISCRMSKCCATTSLTLSIVGTCLACNSAPAGLDVQTGTSRRCSFRDLRVRVAKLRRSLEWHLLSQYFYCWAKLRPKPIPVGYTRQAFEIPRLWSPPEEEVRRITTK